MIAGTLIVWTRGVEVFFDEGDITGGTRLAGRLQEGLASARVVVSAAAVGKPWWQEESGAAPSISSRRADAKIAATGP